MDATRRDFLAGIAATAMAAAVPFVRPEPGLFDRTREYGNAIEFHTSNVDKEDIGDLIDILMTKLGADARKTLPPGTRFEIRGKIPTDFGRRRGLAWYYNPDMRLESHWKEGRDASPSLDPDAGYYLHARMIA